MKYKLILLCALVLPVAAPLAFAKLPEPTPAAKATAADAAARTAWSTKVETYQLCKSQDQVAAQYRARAEAGGKAAPAAMPTPACTDPGPYVAEAPATETKPIEASGAHSPATTAASPPSTNQTSAETNPAPK